jgi:hypothetical protein
MSVATILPNKKLSQLYYSFITKQLPSFSLLSSAVVCIQIKAFLPVANVPLCASALTQFGSSHSIFRFGVLQLRLHRCETIHLEVVASKAGYLNILRDRVCALFILQAKAVRIALSPSTRLLNILRVPGFALNVVVEPFTPLLTLT